MKTKREHSRRRGTIGKITAMGTNNRRSARLIWRGLKYIIRKAEFRGNAMMKFKIALAALSAAAMIGSQAMAADVSGALAPGKPAGVREAQRGPNLYLVGGGVAIAVVAIVVATQSGGDNACGAACSPATTATST
jgi:hypothetical protein